MGYFSTHAWSDMAAASMQYGLVLAVPESLKCFLRPRR